MDISEIRKRKLEELQHAQRSASAQDFVNQQIEGVKKTVLQRYLTKEARERLGNVRIGNPMVAEQVEIALFEAVQAGQIREPLDDNKLKEILSKVNTKKGFKIIR